MKKRKTRTSTNSGTISILQILTFIMGLLFVWTIIGLPIAILLIFLEGFMVNYEYTCPECGNKVGKDSNKCFTCNVDLI